MTDEEAAREFATAVMVGLSDRPRWLPCRYLYDARGSELFDAITSTPEYYPTRTEASILAESAAAIAEITGSVTLVELGAGSSAKTGRLLDAYARGGRPVRYLPVDVSATALEAGTRMIAARHPGVTIAPINGTYDVAFALLPDAAPVMLVFLGSTVGNFNQTEAATFWARVSAHLSPGDFVLLGVDLVKDPAIINAAYNDAAGHSAAFTRNIFARMNRELGSSLDLAAIEHEAAYNAAWQRVEIFARFTTAQSIRLAPLGRSVAIGVGERIMTEISRKYVIGNLEAYLQCFGLTLRRCFADPQGWFAELLLQRDSGP
ncbi:MAG: L-histidine N(alpha)-methyltransferase [Gemmatimonadales bacterium]